MVMPCSRSASRPSVRSDRSRSSWPRRLRGARHRGELVLEDGAGVVQQPPDQRALAVVDAARGDEAQHAEVLRGCSVALEFAEQRHQKYPSFLRRSIEASDVWSSMRVAPRSVTVVSTVSAMISAGGRGGGFDRAGAGDVAYGAEAHRQLPRPSRLRAAA